MPGPDYPLWTASVALSGGTPVHYRCAEEDAWQPDLADLESRITERTRGIVVINPNNPTGAVYSKETLKKIADIARRHGLMIFADEIYEKITYDGVELVNMATLTGDDVLCLTFSGLSKAYRVAGYRSGAGSRSPDRWRRHTATSRGSSCWRICACARTCRPSMPSRRCTGRKQSIDDLVLPTGRLGAQMQVAHEGLNSIDGVSAHRADGALYMFAKLDVEKFGITDDEQFALDLLREQKILVSHGTAFNWPKPDHFRLVTLPSVEVLSEAIERLDTFRPVTVRSRIRRVSCRSCGNGTEAGHSMRTTSAAAG